MAAYIEPLAQLVNELSKLPSIGKRTALRLAYHLLEVDKEEAFALSNAIKDIRENVNLCSECGDFTQEDKCFICNDNKRDKSIICVVGDPRNISVMERCGEFKGIYHVLHGTISPNDNRGPEDIRIRELVSRLGDVKEVILATNPDLEGEATAIYIARLIKPMNIKVTRIAHGVPVGSDIQYADEVTLARALNGRTEI